MTKDVIQELEWRGLVYQKTPAIEKAFEKGTTIYWGIDPTGDSLHIGHLLGAIVLRRLHLMGQKIVLLVGGGTAMIGDPGGKDAERPILPKEQIEANKAKIKQQLSRFFEFNEDTVRMVDNSEWLESVRLIDFLREAGKYISVNSMIDKDSVASRITRQEGISYAEFSYQLLQAYDFMQLHDVYHCEVQIGGSDQWGNMVQGVELIRKKNGESSYSLSYPLIINPKTGKKFGKTESGSAIWLDPEKTHPFDFYQFLVNIDDEMAPLLMKYFSFKTHDEIQELQILWDTEREKRLLQKTLAFEVTALVHGQEVAHQCRQIASILFEKGSEAITVENLEFIKKALPYATIKSGEEFIKENVILQLGLVSSKGEARRLIEQNGVKEELLFGKYYLIRKGKRDYGIIELV